MSVAPKQVGLVSAITDLATGGAIALGAGLRIEQHRALTINQTTAAQTATLPAPTDSTVIFALQVTNIGTAALTMYGTTLTSHTSATFYWDGTQWTTVVAASSMPTIQTLTPTAQNTIPNVTTAPRAGSPAQFFVNGDFVASGLAMSAAGAITATAATVGYNIETTDRVTVVYYA